MEGRERRVVPSFYPNTQLKISLYLALFRLRVCGILLCTHAPYTPSPHIPRTMRNRGEGGGWGTERERETG